jgi:hypothetical protein
MNSLSLANGIKQVNDGEPVGTPVSIFVRLGEPKSKQSTRAR